MRLMALPFVRKPLGFSSVGWCREAFFSFSCGVKILRRQPGDMKVYLQPRDLTPYAIIALPDRSIPC